jgi:hypothetical protein
MPICDGGALTKTIDNNGCPVVSCAVSCPPVVTPECSPTQYVQTSTDPNGCTIETCVETICPAIAPIQCPTGFETTIAYDTTNCPQLQCVYVNGPDGGFGWSDAGTTTSVPIVDALPPTLPPVKVLPY